MVTRRLYYLAVFTVAVTVLSETQVLPASAFFAASDSKVGGILDSCNGSDHQTRQCEALAGFTCQDSYQRSEYIAGQLKDELFTPSTECTLSGCVNETNAQKYQGSAPKKCNSQPPE